MTKSSDGHRFLALGFGGYLVSFLLSTWHYSPFYTVPEIASNLVVIYATVLIDRATRKARREYKRIEAEFSAECRQHLQELMDQFYLVGLVVEDDALSLVVRGQSVDVASLPIDDTLRQRTQTWIADFRPDKLPMGPEGGDKDWQAEGDQILSALRDVLIQSVQ